jgi:hypothetical protein
MSMGAFTDNAEATEARMNTPTPARNIRRDPNFPARSPEISRNIAKAST